MRTICSVIALATGVAACGSASAQSWGAHNGLTYQAQYRDNDDSSDAGDVCSGSRARQLEDRLNNEANDGDISDEVAGRIHTAIDRLEGRQREECAEGDQRAIDDLADRYDRIDHWIDSEEQR